MTQKQQMMQKQQMTDDAEAADDTAEASDDDQAAADERCSTDRQDLRSGKKRQQPMSSVRKQKKHGMHLTDAQKELVEGEER